MKVANYREHADALVNAAAASARKKLIAYARVVSDLWSEASSIPSGCGGTPFRTDARNAEARLQKMVKEYKAKFGKKEMITLRKECYYGDYYLEAQR